MEPESMERIVRLTERVEALERAHYETRRRFEALEAAQGINKPDKPFGSHGQTEAEHWKCVATMYSNRASALEKLLEDLQNAMREMSEKTP
jgi:hypothetical protein